MPVISILIPVYKVEDYLARCIDSVLMQDFQDWEMILVDDGSPDRCPQICDDYADKDGRIRVVHQANGGVVSARKRGFNASCGDYVCFIDADDTFCDGALGVMVSIVYDRNLDVLKCAEQIASEERDNKTIMSNAMNGMLTQEEYILGLLSGKLSGTLHASLYRRSIIDDYVFDIDRRFRLGEDYVMNYRIANNIKNAYICDAVVYNYTYNRKSAMQSYVMSREYNDAIGEIIRKSVRIETVAIKSYFNQDHIPRIASFFVPELTFSDEIYCQMRHWLERHSRQAAIAQGLKPAYLYFIGVKPLYRLYTALWRFAYLWIHQHGKSRNVIY